jgi:Mg-chelatase subunit ChlD
VRLFIDGTAVATNAIGVTNWPGFTVRSAGFCVGSSRDGTNQCRGRIDNLDTCDYDRPDTDILNQYTTTCFSAMDVILVIDRSLSMTNAGSAGHTKLQDAQQAATNFIKQLNFNLDHAGVVSFNTSSTLNQRLTNNATPLISAVAGITASGNTTIYTGITNAQAELMSTRHTVGALPFIVLLTDGSNQPTSSITDSNTVYFANQAKSNGTRVVAVALGAGADTNLHHQFVFLRHQLDTA